MIESLFCCSIFMVISSKNSHIPFWWITLRNLTLSSFRWLWGLKLKIGLGNCVTNYTHTKHLDENFSIPFFNITIFIIFVESVTLLIFKKNWWEKIQFQSPSVIRWKKCDRNTRIEGVYRNVTSFYGWEITNIQKRENQDQSAAIIYTVSLFILFFSLFMTQCKWIYVFYAHGIKLNWFMLFFLIFLCSSDNCHNDAVVLCVCQKRKKILFNDFGEKRKGESLLEFPNIS